MQTTTLIRYSFEVFAYDCDVLLSDALIVLKNPLYMWEVRYLDKG